MIDDLLLQEIQSLREQIKILAHITYTYNPDVDISVYLRHLKTEDYQEFIEHNTRTPDINTETLRDQVKTAFNLMFQDNPPSNDWNKGLAIFKAIIKAAQEVEG